MFFILHRDVSAEYTQFSASLLFSDRVFVHRMRPLFSETAYLQYVDVVFTILNKKQSLKRLRVCNVESVLYIFMLVVISQLLNAA